jgi:hypothetical protein
MSRVDDVPVYEQRNDQVSAKLYNLWRRAKLHFAMPLRLEFAETPGVVMLLDRHEWACVNDKQGDMPLLAWVEFEDQRRAALHTAVSCKLNYYHYAASMYRAKVLQLTEQRLEEMLKETAPV